MSDISVKETWRTAFHEECVSVVARERMHQLPQQGTDTVLKGRLILHIGTTFPNILSCTFYL
jgi:hypothetical protein